MKVTKFTLDRPDADGSMSVSATLSVANPTTEDVRWIQYNVAYLDQRGFPLACSNDSTEDCTIEPSESLDVTAWGGIPAQVVGDSRDNVLLGASAVLHAREFYKLGTVDVPATDGGSAAIEREITSSIIDSPVRVLLFRNRMDSDGQVRVDCRVALRNKTDLHLARVELKCELLDQDEAVTETNNDQVVLPARSLAAIESGIGWLKKSQFKGATMRLSLYLFRPIHTATCTGTSTPSAD